MFGSFFDPFGYVNGYRVPQRQQPAYYNRPVRQPQRSFLDDFDPFGSAYPFRPASSHYGEGTSDSSSDDGRYGNNRNNRAAARSAYGPQRPNYRTEESSSDEYDNGLEAPKKQLGEDEEARQRSQKEKEAEAARAAAREAQAAAEKEKKEKEKEKEKAAEEWGRRHREISKRRRQAQLERAQRQDAIRRQQQKEASEQDAPAQEAKCCCSVPHTLLKSTRGYIVAANIPGYPADAVQISATSDRVTVTLHHVHLALPDAAPVEGYPALEAIVGQSTDNKFEIKLPSPISVDDSDATLSGGRLLINLPFLTQEDMARALKEKEAEAEVETTSARDAMSQYNKTFSEDAEDWTGILQGLGNDKDTLKKETEVQATLVPITML